jgi:hypothetical protein
MSVKNRKQEAEVSMNDITVVISGMILLMSPYAYDQTGSHKIHSAVAVNASKPLESKYGLSVPLHFAALVFKAGDLDRPGKTQDPDNRLNDVDGSTRVELEGDLVQIGIFDDGQNKCVPIKDDPTANDAAIDNSILDLPRMGELVTKPLLDDKTYPVNGSYIGVDATRVASWFEIPLGAMHATHSGYPQQDAVMFPPVHKNAVVAAAVNWHIDASNKADCVLVSPFIQPSKFRIDIVFKPGNVVSVGYENKADMTTGFVMPGVGFDFEVLYSLYKEQPAMPPLPFSARLLGHQPNMAVAPAVKTGRTRSSGKTTTPLTTHTPFNPTTGVNCGPATIPSGG